MWRVEWGVHKLGLDEFRRKTHARVGARAHTKKYAHDTGHSYPGGTDMRCEDGGYSRECEV